MINGLKRNKRQKAERRGRRGEWFAAIALQIKGYRIIERGFRTKFGEIDIVARKGNLVAIVEVKARANVEAALNAVSLEAQHRISNTADIWLSRQKDFGKLSVRFDIVAVVPGSWPKHFPGAF